MITSSKPQRYLHCVKSIPSRQRQPKHQLKQSLLGPFQESSEQTADFDSSQTNVYPRQTAWLVTEYEEAVRRQFGYLFVVLLRHPLQIVADVCYLEKKDVTKGSKRATFTRNCSSNLKQQTLMGPPLISKMQRIQNNMDNLLYTCSTYFGDDKKARQYMQLQNKFFTDKHQLNSSPEATILTQPQGRKQLTYVLASNLPTVPAPIQEPPVIYRFSQA